MNQSPLQQRLRSATDPAKLMNQFMLSIDILSYGCRWEALEHERSIRVAQGDSREQLWLLECSPNLPNASITQYTQS